MENRGGARGPKKLDADQQVRLDAVRAADDAWREAKLTLRTRLRAQLEAELLRYAMARDKAVYEAVQHDVPKSRLAEDGLRTSPNAVYDALERHKALVGAPGMPELAPEAVDPYYWELISESAASAFYALRSNPPTDHSATFTTLDGEVINVAGGWLYGVGKGSGEGMFLGGLPDASVLAWVARNPIPV